MGWLLQDGIATVLKNVNALSRIAQYGVCNAQTRHFRELNNRVLLCFGVNECKHNVNIHLFSFSKSLSFPLCDSYDSYDSFLFVEKEQTLNNLTTNMYIIYTIVLLYNYIYIY